MSPATHEGKTFLFNTEIKPIEDLSQEWFSCYKHIYEVIRVVNRSPVFLDYHIERLNRSCTLSGFEPIDRLQLRTSITQFISQEWEQECNIKLSLCYSKYDDNSPHVLAHYIPSHYPTPAMYNHGVSVGLLPQSRPKPNVKAHNQPLREMADSMIKANGYYEVLLVNGSGCITEGSRSNFFIVVKGRLITPPAGEVLEGITRRVVIELLQEHGIECVQESIPAESIQHIQGAFLTGTSPKVLPIRQIGSLILPKIPILVRQIMGLYNHAMTRNNAN